jgi:hypothetical protein
MTLRVSSKRRAFLVCHALVVSRTPRATHLLRGLPIVLAFSSTMTLFGCNGAEDIGATADASGSVTEDGSGSDATLRDTGDATFDPDQDATLDAGRDATLEGDGSIPNDGDAADTSPTPDASPDARDASAPDAGPEAPDATPPDSGPTARCGDGVRNQVGEQCDTFDLAGATCASVLGNDATGTLRCSAACAFDTSGCHACAPSCVGKTCGDDGCGGTCGGCPTPATCSSAGRCVLAGGCEPPTQCPLVEDGGTDQAQYCLPPGNDYTQCIYCPQSCGVPQYMYDCTANGGPGLPGCAYLSTNAWCCPTAACIRSTPWDGTCASDGLPPRSFTCHPAAAIPSGCVPMAPGQAGKEAYQCCP